MNAGSSWYSLSLRGFIRLPPLSVHLGCCNPPPPPSTPQPPIPQLPSHLPPAPAPPPPPLFFKGVWGKGISNSKYHFIYIYIYISFLQPLPLSIVLRKLPASNIFRWCSCGTLYQTAQIKSTVSFLFVCLFCLFVCLLFGWLVGCLVVIVCCCFVCF